MKTNKKGNTFSYFRIRISIRVFLLLGRYGWTEAVEALMENQNVKIINLKNSQGKTALHFACTEGHDYTAEVLLKLGADIERYISMEIEHTTLS